MTETNRKASATARTRATTKYHKAHYKRMYISTTPEQADYIRETAKKYDITIVQLILNSIKLFEENAKRLPAGAATPSGTAAPTQPEPEKPEQDTTESPIESRETAGAQPEEEIEEETTEEENQTAEAETTAGAEEEPQEDENEDEKPEDIPAFVWEQIQRLKKADKRHTAERKAREAAERKRRRLGEIED